MADKKYSVLAVLDVLQKNTGIENPMYLKEIKFAVKDKYGIDISEKTIRSDLQALQDFGYDIRYLGVYERVIEHSDGTKINSRIKKNCYLIGPIEDYYIEILFDALLNERYLNESDYRNIAKKLEQLSTTKNFRINRSSALRIIPDYDRFNGIYRDISTIRKAIAKRKSISFNYETVDTRIMQGSKQRNRMTVSPHKVFSDNGIYYLLGYTAPFSSDESRVLLRIDCMKEIEIGTLPRIDGLGGEVKRFSVKRFRFIPEGSITGICRLPKALLSDAIDFFGPGKMKLDSFAPESAEEKYTITITAPEKALLRFTLINAPDVEIIGPDNLRKQLMNILSDTYNLHKI